MVRSSLLFSCVERAIDNEVRVRPAAAVALISLLASSPAVAADPDPDPWLSTDKTLHFGVSAGIAVTGYAASTAVFDARGHALLVAGGVTLAAGAGKEVLDLAGFGTPSWKDFVADVAGMLVGLAVAWSVDLVVRGVSERHPLVHAPREARSSSLFPPTRPTGITLSF